MAPGVFVFALIPGLAMTVNSCPAAEHRVAEDFQRSADPATDRVVSRVRQQFEPLRATRGLWAAAGGAVMREEFRRFLTSVDLVNELSGVRGIGFAPMIPSAEAVAIGLEIEQTYGVAVAPPRPTDQPWRSPVLEVEPADSVTLPASGFVYAAFRVLRPGIWWIGSRRNRSGFEVQTLQTYS
jgi:CHASE1-domain containing sensor protein